MSYSIENCPHCEIDVCNGMGPATMKRVTYILNKTNTAEFFKRECNMHDMDFHLWRGFKRSNKYFKSRMKAKVNKTKFKGNFISRFAKRQWFGRIVTLIAWTVTGKSGRDAYAKGKCTKLPKRRRNRG